MVALRADLSEQIQGGAVLLLGYQSTILNSEMIKSRWVIFLILLLRFASFSAFSESTLITMAADPWPPFADPDAEGEGLAIRIVRAAFESQGYEVEMKFLPWARALQSVQEGIFDIIPTIWVSREREDHYDFSDPFLINTIVVIKRATDQFEYTGLNSLAGKKIGLIRGYSYDEEFLAATNYQKVTVSYLIQSLFLLTSYRIDLVVEDLIVARMLLNRQEESLRNSISFVDNPLSQKALHIAVSKNTPRGREILDIFNTGLMEIRNNGTYNALIREYHILSESIPPLKQ